MDAATGDVSEAGFERAEVVLLEADLAASTALDMSVLCGVERGEMKVWVWEGVSSKGRAVLGPAWGVEQSGTPSVGEDGARYVGGFF